MKQKLFSAVSFLVIFFFFFTLIPTSVSAISFQVPFESNDFKGMLPLNQLETAKLSEGDIPEVLTSNNVNTNDLVHRVRSAEDEYSLVFQKSDGICQKFVFTEPIQYRDSSGNLKDKKTKTILIGEEYTTTETDIVLKIPKSLNNGIKIKYDDLNLKMTPIGLMSKNKTYCSSEENSFLYKDTYDAFTDIRYTPTFSGVKCDIILEKYTGKNVFEFEINTNNYSLERDNASNTVFIADKNGEPILYFNPIISYDSAGNISFGDIDFQRKNGNKYTVSISVDNSFLTDTSTVYPVTVDPSASVNKTHNASLEYLCVYSNGTSISSTSSSTSDMLVGTSSNGIIGRVLYRFDGLEGVPAKSLVKAELIQTVRTSSDFFPMDSYAYDGNTWNHSSKYSDLLFAYIDNPVMTTQYGNNFGTNTKYMTIDVTNFVNLCQSNPQTYSLDKGILLKNITGEQSPEYTATDSNVAITTYTTTASPSAACLAPYLVYTYEPFRIMLDAGHATSSNATGYHEGNRMWQLHLYLKSELLQLGYDVGVTRTNSSTDTPVATRGAMADGYDMFISLHSNAFDDPNVNRVVVIYDIYDKNQASVFADQIGASVRNTMNSGGLNISSVQIWQRPLTYTNGDIYYNEDGLMENYYGVLRAAAQTDCPLYYIVEHSFHTNPDTATWLNSNSNLQALAEAEAAAIDAYLNP